ncbi:MAG: hypothetical protein CMO47_14755 [Verrucomicrobiales bacterium]|nr:hypothetical protein [Verrucomicrobiales bacterium]
MSDQLTKIGEIHDLVIEMTLERLREGDTRAVSDAMALIKNSNVTAVAAEGSTLRKLAGKLDFSEMEDKVVQLKQKAV